MTAMSVRDVRAEAVREQVMRGVHELIESGDPVTFGKVAAAAGVPERTVYRYFATRDALIAALYEHANAKIGFEGEPPTTAAAMTEMVSRVFPGFDTIAPVIDELLRTPEGRRARLARLDTRRKAATAVVRDARPDLDAATTRQLAAVVQVLGTAAVWRALRDFWEMDGKVAAAAVTTAITRLLTPGGA
jgi:AcrR family transcriptional regulator